MYTSIPLASQVVEHEDVNKMSATNLSIVFGPNLLWSQNEVATLNSMSEINRFTLFLTENHSRIFWNIVQQLRKPHLFLFPLETLLHNHFTESFHSFMIWSISVSHFAVKMLMINHFKFMVVMPELCLILYQNKANVETVLLWPIPSHCKTTMDCVWRLRMF